MMLEVNLAQGMAEAEVGGNMKVRRQCGGIQAPQSHHREVLLQNQDQEVGGGDLLLGHQRLMISPVQGHL